MAPLKHLLAALVLSAGLVPSVAFAGWREEASDHDIARLQQLEQYRDKAVAEAQAGSGTGDFRALKGTLEASGHAVPEGALLGSWRCRQMKMGGVNPYIVYGWFNCSIHRANGGLFFQKLNGTLRTQGFLYPENGAWVYLGAASAKDEPWHRYSGRAASLGAETTPDDQIGLLAGIGNNHLRLEIPGPAEESTYDVIEMQR